MDAFSFYSIQSRLGQGAMGAVYLAQDKRLQRPVALKVLSLDIPAEQRNDYARQLEQEARAAARLNHPNIITIYECGFANGLPFIAMEQIDGPSLKELLAKGRHFSPDRIVKVMRQLLNGLAYAHSMGIVHRDVKPANIMFTSSGVLKLTDFGIAHLMAGDWTHTNALSGSPCYMSPEQVRSAPLDGRSDLFSVGVVMYELLTGRLPFVSDNMASIVYQIMFETPPAPRELNPKVPTWLSDVVMTCLQKEPQHRYQDAESCIKALKAGGRGPVAQPQPLANVAGSPAAPRHAASAGKLVRWRQPLLLLCLLAGLGMIVWRNLHPPEAVSALPVKRLARVAAVPAAPSVPLVEPAAPRHVQPAAEPLPAPPASSPAVREAKETKPAKRRAASQAVVARKPLPRAEAREPETSVPGKKAPAVAASDSRRLEVPKAPARGEEKNAVKQQKGFWQQQADCLLRSDCDPAQLKRPRIR